MLGLIKEIRFHIKIFLLLSFGCSYAFICHADPLSSVMEDWQPAGISGTLLISENEYIVNENIVLVVNQIFKNSICKTKVFDTYGNELSQASLSNGINVFVKGGGTNNDETNTVIVAKEIYILPREMDRKELERLGLYNNTPEPW